MLARVRRHPGAGRGARLARPALLTLGLLVFLLLVPATANADVMAKYRAKYKNKLTYYRNQMDSESDTFYTASKQAVELTSSQLGIALADPEHPEVVQAIKQMALDERSQLQKATQETRDAMVANIAAFRAKAVRWFKTRADKSRFKARLATMKAGFTQMYSAEESLMRALYHLGVNADIASCANEIMAGDMTRITAEDRFEKGLRQLRALQ